MNAAFGLQVADRGRLWERRDRRQQHRQVAFANNPTGAKLGGTASVNASQGVASFSNLTINKVGTGYTLQLTSNGLTSAVTSVINVTKTATSTPAVTTAGLSTSATWFGALTAEVAGFLDRMVPRKPSRGK